MKQAVIKTGGKQYIVKKGDIIDIEKIDKKEGSTIDFKEVLLVTDDKTVKVGKPKVAGAKVSGKIVSQYKGDKIYIIKYKPKVRYRKKTGHRQLLTKVKIESITV